jgi:hypothetical protein
VSACPKPGALCFGFKKGKGALTPLLFALLLGAAFVLIPHAFRAFGYWESDTPLDFYRRHFPTLSELGHPHA